VDKKAADIAANEIPEGTHIVYSEFAERGNFYSCSYQHDVVYAKYTG
jgi:hypothetical protein